jgi:translation initiation factor eIF-2B subunit epsilon
VHGILTSDLLMKSIHCYVVTDGYAARVQDTKSYESIRWEVSLTCTLRDTYIIVFFLHSSKDILSRWTFPLVPDGNHPGGHVYEHRRGNKYIAKDHTVVLSR